jgi:CheY-like chemotaxis protein
MIGDALRAAIRGGSLTHHLLAYSRQQPLAPKAVDIESLVLSVIELLKRTLGETVDIRANLASDLWLTRIDPHQLENALLNLAVNARDAMPEGGRLTIEAANTTLDETYAEQNFDVAPGQYVMLAISDSGAGIPADVLDRVMEPFFTTKPVGEGSGLGLSMVYGFVKQSGGHMKIYSEPGYGTSVRLYLPKAAGGDQTAEPEPAQIAAGDVGDELILVVEDDPMIRKLTVRVLNGLGYHTLEAADGPAAQTILDSGVAIDLLLTDVVLPKGVSGPDLAAKARHQNPTLRVLYMSGYTKNAIVHNSMLDEGVHLLTKPFPKAELARKVRELLDEGKSA